MGIYDLKVFPWDVGDPLIFVEILNVLKIKHKADAVDVCVIYDRDSPGYREKNNLKCNLTSENAQDYMFELLPLFSTCQYPGSIYQFNSRREFRRFLRMNIRRYEVFPPLGQQLGEVDIYRWRGILRPIMEFYDIHKYIPYLRIGRRDECWARWLYARNLPEGAVSVTLSLKGTMHRTECNADPSIWLSFIDRCKVNFPEVVFFVVGLREEVFEGLRDRSNVIIAKDFGTSIIEDLALIRSSLMHMGTSSGVNVIAMFSDLPYIMTQLSLYTYLQHGIKPDEKFSFMLDTQKIFSVNTAVTTEFLFNEFKETYLSLDKDKWYSITLQRARNKDSHPTTKVLS